MSRPIFPVQPIIEIDASVAKWLRRDGCSGTTAAETVFTGASQASTAPASEQNLTRMASALAYNISEATDPGFLLQRTHSCRGIQRRSRVLRWWWQGSRWALLLSAAFSVLIAAAVGLFAREGWGLTPVTVVVITALVAISLASGYLSFRARRGTHTQGQDLTPSQWAQYLAAERLREEFELLRSLCDSGYIISSTDDTVIQAACRKSYWRYRSLVEDVVDESSEGAEHLALLDSCAGAFQPPLIDEPYLNNESTDSSDDTELDATYATALTLGFALIVGGTLIFAPASLVDAQSCSFAKAEIRIERCQDLTHLDASGLSVRDLDLAGRNLEGSDFSNATLAVANFTGTNLMYSTLKRAAMPAIKAQRISLAGADGQALIGTKGDFSKGDFSKGDFSSADLSGANLTSIAAFQASLTNANLSKANLSRANLESADLSGANLDGANFSEANLSYSDLRNTNWRAATVDGVDLTGANMAGLNLSGMNLDGYKLDSVDLSGANLKGASLRNSSLRNANLQGANIEGLVLAGADLEGVSVKELLDGGANLDGVDLSGSDLTALSGLAFRLNDAQLQGVDLTGLDLRKANFDGSSLEGSLLNGADLRGASFVASNLSNTDLTLADLSDANLANAKLVGALLTDARIVGADMKGAILTNAKLAGSEFTNSNLTNATGLGANAASAVWKDATCPNGQKAEICRS